jgi:hypothetical protein
MSKFTEGTWMHVDMPVVREVFNGCSVIISDQIEDAIIASIGEDVPNHTGNANLIAAAPEMYEALKDCIEQIRALCSDDDVPTSARKALAKADGAQ